MASRSEMNRHKRRLLESMANEEVAASSAQLHDATESAEQVEVQFSYVCSEAFSSEVSDSDTGTYYSFDERGFEEEATSAEDAFDGAHSAPSLADELLLFTLIYNLPRTAVQFLLDLLLRHGINLPKSAYLLRKPAEAEKISQCASTHEVQDLLNRLNDMTFKASVIRQIRQVGGTTVRAFVRLAVSVLLTNDMQTKFNRHGVDNRLRFIGQLEDVTKQAALQSFPKSNEREIEQAIAAALKNAADRMGGRQRRMKSRNDEPE